MSNVGRQAILLDAELSPEDLRAALQEQLHDHVGAVFSARRKALTLVLLAELQPGGRLPFSSTELFGLGRTLVAGRNCRAWCLRGYSDSIADVSIVAMGPDGKRRWSQNNKAYQRMHGELGAGLSRKPLIELHDDTIFEPTEGWSTLEELDFAGPAAEGEWEAASLPKKVRFKFPPPPIGVQRRGAGATQAWLIRLTGPRSLSDREQDLTAFLKANGLRATERTETRLEERLIEEATLAAETAQDCSGYLDALVVRDKKTDASIGASLLMFESRVWLYVRGPLS